MVRIRIPLPHAAPVLLTIALAVGHLYFVPSANANPTVVSHSEPTLSSALAAAWERHPWNLSAKNRQIEFDGRVQQNSALFAGAPALTISHGNDSIGSANGKRNFEFEASAPLWNGGVRTALAEQIKRDRLAFFAAGQVAKYKLAGELRELLARHLLAVADLKLAERRQLEAKQLADDIARRAKVGELARVDSLTARGQLNVAQLQVETAASALAELAIQWQGATGLRSFPTMLDTIDEPINVDPERSVHPLVLHAKSMVESAQAKIETAIKDQRDPIELGIGVSSERTTFGAARDNAIRLSIRLPLGGVSRNAGRLSAARADFDEASAQLQQIERQVQSEVQLARTQERSIQVALVSAQSRSVFAGEAQALFTKAYRLGEVDLATRLRADNEKFDADLAVARLHIARQRANAQLQHALGLLP